MTAQAGLQTPSFPARHWNGVALRTCWGETPFLLLPHTLCSLSCLCASCPLKKDLWADWKTGPHRGQGCPGLFFQTADRWRGWAPGDTHFTPMHLPSSPSLSASSFSFLTSLSARCSPKLPVHSPHPQTSALLGDHIRKQMWMCWTSSWRGIETAWDETWACTRRLQTLGRLSWAQLPKSAGEWINTWVDEWMDGWMDGWKDGQRMDEWMGE